MNASMYIAVVVAGLLVQASAAMAAEPKADRRLTVTLRTRTAGADGAWTVKETKATWDATKTAAIICDMWDKHWCKGATRRVAEMAPHMNELLRIAREKGVLVIHAPSACMKTYKDHPARKRALGAAKVPDTPNFLGRWAAKLDTEKGAAWPIDQSDGGCDCQPKCRQGGPWRSQIATIKIHDEDAVTDSGVHTWNLLKARGIDNVLVMGVHTNMCVIGRPFGLRNLKRAGKNVVLVRDMTDTMYNPPKSPFVNHFRGTGLIVEYIEKYVCPTTTSTDITGGAEFGFKNDPRGHVVFLIAEREYKTPITLPTFAARCLEPKDLRCTFVRAASDSGAGRHEMPGFDAVKTADLLLVSMRRRALKPAQLDLIRAHLKAGRPLVGIRTASHAFDAGGKPPKGSANWKEFDGNVLGGHYHGHHGAKHKTKVTIAEGAKEHPILRSVRDFPRPGSLYKTRPLAKTATPLLMGAIHNAEAEPVAWTNTCGKARIFYTSLGHLGDFEDPNFVRMLTNAVFWTMNKPIPDKSRKAPE